MEINLGGSNILVSHLKLVIFIVCVLWILKYREEELELQTLQKSDNFSCHFAPSVHLGTAHLNELLNPSAICCFCQEKHSVFASKAELKWHFHLPITIPALQQSLPPGYYSARMWRCSWFCQWSQSEMLSRSQALAPHKSQPDSSSVGLQLFYSAIAGNPKTT